MAANEDARLERLWAESLAEARALLAEPEPNTPGQEALDGLGTTALSLDQPPPLSVDLLRSAILGARDPPDLESRLAVLLDRQDPGFADALAVAGFCADVLGYVNAEENRS